MTDKEDKGHMRTRSQAVSVSIEALSAFVIVFAACGPSVAPTPSAPAAAPSLVPDLPRISPTSLPRASRSESGRSRRVSVALVHAPYPLTLDGDLSEWSNPPKSGVNAPQHVALAISPSGFALSAVLAGDAARKGVWIGIAFCSASAPSTYSYDGVRAGFQCETDPWGESGSSWTRQCKADEREYERFVREHHSQFERWILLDRRGFSLAVGDHLSPVEDAELAERESDEGIRVEATLPLAVLPRAACVPIVQAAVFATPAIDRTRPRIRDDQWARIPFPTPFAPSRYAGLLAQVLEESTGPGGAPRWAASWTPADPMDISYVQRVRGAEWVALERKRGPLFTGGLTYRDLTIVKPLFGNVVTLRGGDLLATTYSWGQSWQERLLPDDDIRSAIVDREAWGSSPLYHVERDGKLLLIEPEFSNFWDPQAGPALLQKARWSVSVVSPDGSAVEGIEGEPDVRDWEEVEMLHSSDFKTLTIAGIASYAYGDPKPRTELTWKYDAKKGKYLPVTKKAPPASTKKPSSVIPRSPAKQK